MSKHRVLIIGTGSIGERHVRCFLATGRASVSICEPNKEIRERIASSYNLENIFESADDALSSGWDVVLIATPANTHIPIAMNAVPKCKALLIEKPLAIALDGVEELLRSIDDHGIVAGVSYNHRAHPGYRAMKKHLDDGSLGKPLHLVMSSGQEFAKYRPAYASIYFANHATGGGALQDSLTHNLNVGEYLVGSITRIAADAAHQQLPGVEVEDTIETIARHGDVLASYTLNMYQAPNESTMTIACERGTIRFELHNARVRIMREADGEWEDEHYPLADRDDWYIQNANAFLDAAEGKSQPLCSVEEGAQTLRAVIAAQASIAESPLREVGGDG